MLLVRSNIFLFFLVGARLPRISVVELDFEVLLIEGNGSSKSSVTPLILDGNKALLRSILVGRGSSVVLLCKVRREIVL